ncbi:FIST N-terminal domain-containing protein, partial [Arthrospira platensis SPKY1]|nr:FIST N-terminal domain-containing protein [Arthrospira platensis SPKY1]
MLKAIRKVLGKTPLIGCTTAGEFTEKQVAKESVALTLMSASPNYAFHVSMAMGLHEDAEKTVKKAVKLLPKRPPRFPYRSAILLADGLAG